MYPTEFLKADLMPTSSSLMVNLPLSSVVAVLPSLRRLTEAPLIALPWSSETVPEIVYADANPQNAKRLAAVKSLGDLKLMFTPFTKIPKTHLIINEFNFGCD
jgi:hypothetical protein